MTESSRHDRNENRVPRHPVLFVLPDSSGRIDPDWLEQAADRLPGQGSAPRGTVAGPSGAIELAEVDASPGSPEQWAGALAESVGDGWLLVVRSGLELPADFVPRMAAALQDSDSPAPVVAPGNYNVRTDPLHEMDLGTAPEDTDFDSLVSVCGLQRRFGIHRPPLGCAAFGPAAIEALAAGIRSDGWMADTLYVQAPPESRDRPSEAAPSPPLGHIRAGVGSLLDEGIRSLPAIGRDGRPVTLHITHNWGGGIARWIRDMHDGDLENGESGSHHLVLSAGSNFEDRTYGKHLTLYAAGPDRGRIHRWPLMPAIADTVENHPTWPAILDSVIRRFQVGRILVSSLIGHSLQALETGLPTAVVLHDYYPAWPLLDRDPGESPDGDGQPDLSGALDAHGDSLLFERRDPEYWAALTRAWLDRVEKHQPALIAPSQCVIDRWHWLTGRTELAIDRIPHGFRGWPEPLPAFQSSPRADGRLNLVVVGQLSPGKGSQLLAESLERIKPLARITLVGCGRHGMEFFGQAGVDVIYRYANDRLPEILATLRPQAALFLSTTAETFNYTLSEIRSLGIVPVATRLGSFAERIVDGRDGVLFEPDPESLFQAIARLEKDPGLLEKLAEKAPTEPTVAQMISAYDSKLAPTPPARLPGLANAGVEESALAGLSDMLARTREENTRLRQADETRESELARRARWAETMERQFRQRTRWARSLEQDLESTESLRRKTQEELEGRIRDLQAITAERAQILASRSWKITRPIRVATRMGRNARQRGLANPLNWPGAVARLLHQIRLRGLKNAFWSLQSEPPSTSQVPTPLRSQTPDPDTPLVPVQLPDPGHPEISIVIPVYNQVHFTRACLDSISKTAGSRPFEVIVVDDSSQDETREFLEACTGIRILRNHTNLGFIGACNRGARMARGDYLVFLNNDTTVTEGWLDALIETFDRFPETGIVGGKLIYPDGMLQEAGGIIFSDGSGWNYGRRDTAEKPEYNFACPADYVSGACLAIPKNLWQEFEGFDPHFAPAYYEDTDLCFRVREKGYRVIYQPACTIVHHEGISSGTDETSGTKRYQRINREKFAQRWKGQLARQPDPVPGPQAIRQVRRARHHHHAGHVLVVDATTPTPDQDSGSLRMCAVLKICLDMGFRVTFVPENLAWDGAYSRRLQALGVQTLFAPHTDSLEGWLKEYGGGLNAVIASRHYVASGILPLVRHYTPHARFLFDTVDLHFLREEREAELRATAAARRAAHKTRNQELRLIRQADLTLVVSPAEKDLLESIEPGADIRVLSNIHDIPGRRRGFEERSDLMFVGGFQHPPNVDAALWLANEIFPGLQERLPKVQLHLIGSRMPPAIESLSRPGIVVHGFVPDLEPFLDGCRLALAPLRYGAGVKGKVNQSMSYGQPVVATPCAAEGMYLEDGRDVLVAETTEAFIKAIERGYRDRDLWERISDGGLENVRTHFSFDAARKTLDEILG